MSDDLFNRAVKAVILSDARNNCQSHHFPMYQGPDAFRPLHDRVRAVIAECFKWRPIESAPSTGPDIWVWRQHDNSVSVARANGEFWRYEIAKGAKTFPTMWQPIYAPEPPEQKKTPG